MNKAECTLIMGMIKQLMNDCNAYAFINRETSEPVVSKEIIDRYLSNLYETLQDIYDNIIV